MSKSRRAKLKGKALKGSDLLLAHLKNIIEKNEGAKSLSDSFDFLAGLQVCF